MAVLREKAEELRDGTFKTRGDALLPLTLATFIFDSLCLPGNFMFIGLSFYNLSEVRAKYFCILAEFSLDNVTHTECYVLSLLLLMSEYDCILVLQLSLWEAPVADLPVDLYRSLSGPVLMRSWDLMELLQP